MFFSVFSFEISYRLKHPATYIYFFIFLLITALIIADGGTPATEKVYHNSPAMIGSFFSLLGIFSILVSSAIMGVPLYRDLEHNTKEYLLATPMGRHAYFWGRFWGSFVVLVLVCSGAILGYLLGTFVGPIMDWTEPERFGPNLPMYYICPFLTILIPSLFFTSCIFFGLVAILRNNRVLYTASILVFILYLLSNFLVSDLEKRDLVDLLDPFALNTYSNANKYLTPVEQNTLLTPLTGNLLYNRLLWPAIGLFILLFSYFRFSIGRFVANPSRGGKNKTTDEKTVRVGLPVFNPVFSNRLNWSNLWGLGKLELRNIIRDNYFLSIILGAACSW